ncbi:uncharacterized protein LOC106670554 [Cimex lectularius]|uniref:Uracil-DNA glycosylase n=1 Tax=Cimex lectularius TaxID=79782 RepID=A0A8I6S457_CIMLE|nr:uncharacterized protein LOC106670554 [Cimex lectularius]
MSQKNLLQFFKPSPTGKRPLAEIAGNQVSAKKAKLDSDAQEPKETDSVEKVDSKTKKNESCTPKRLQMSLPFEPKPEDIREEILDFSKKLPIIDPKIGPSWFKALKPEFKKPYFKKLNDFVMSERKSYTIYPPADKVWTWTKECSLKDIKVVILGQDPYHNPNQAHGLCFSVEIGTPPPPSLLNMYKELSTDIQGFKQPNHGYLINWARQGVLLLNACLTVRKNVPNSHKDKGWEQLTTSVIKYLNDHHEGLVFLLWGSYAQKKADFVNKKKHHVLMTVHPSPLSASRGWFGCKHFSRCNEFLTKMGKKPIDWGNV